MPNEVPNKKNNFIHEHIYHLTDQDPAVSFCSKCSSISVSTETETVSTVKPSFYITFVKHDPTVIFSQLSTASFSKNIPGKIEYLKIRQVIIKEMKQLSLRHSLHYKTFFGGLQDEKGFDSWALSQKRRKIPAQRDDRWRLENIFCQYARRGLGKD